MTYWYGSPWPYNISGIALGTSSLHDWPLRRQSTIRHWKEMSVDGEAGVDQGNECRHDVAYVDSFGMVSFRNVEDRRRNNFLPSKAHVRRENHNRSQVEQNPTEGLEDLELHPVDVPHISCGAARSVDPEEVQAKMKNCSNVHQVGWRAELEHLGLSKAELEQMDAHEGEKRNPRNREVQLAGCDSVIDRNVPRTLQRNKHVEQGSQKDVLFHNVCVETKPSPVQADVEVAITIEVVRAQEHVKITHCMDDYEDEQEHCGACQPDSIVGHD